jgi:hypothetical protein
LKTLSQTNQTVNIFYNNNQAFYSQASWGRLEMKPHEPKKSTKQERKIRGKQRAIKNQIKKGEKTIKC